MELRHLRTFEAVVGEGTVTAAADALGCAPSSVSEQIRVLEDSLGIALFDRGPRGMSLTPAGTRMRAWARRLLDQAEQARREVTGAPAVLRLGALETIAVTHVPSVLARLVARRPGLQVEVRSDAARDQLLAAVAAGDLEAALLLDAGEGLGTLGFTPPPAPLDFVDLEPVRLALVGAPGHPLAGRPALVPDDLHGERLLVNGPACSFRLAGERLLGPAVPRVAAGGVAVMRAWAEQGLGIALLPDFAVTAQLAAGTLVRLGLDAPDLALRLVWRSDRESVPGLREVLYAAAAPAAPPAPASSPSGPGAAGVHWKAGDVGAAVREAPPMYTPSP
ncbi:LysR family transcriptional regulator [Streptomyces sp. 150FB]|uniref:LysR family transcriptional regulator n=1 Tax=Streptomyces sp. 150FB TaxID=1576605 RepID=UPI000698A917|nr:LysR family transcriptional regulator [Streptomyces sp. 150FB]